MSLQSVNASVLWMLAAVVPASIAFWCFKRFRKTVAVAVAFSALLLVIGIPAWRDALASLASTPKALALICVPFGVSAAVFGVHVHSARKPRKEKTGANGQSTGQVEAHEDHYGHRRTPLLGIIAGTTGGLVLLDGANVLSNLRKAPAGTGSAWSVASKAVTSGHAAHVAHAGTVPPLAVIAIGAALLGALFWAMGRHRHVQAETEARDTRNGRKSASGTKQPRGLPSGGQSGKFPATREL
jgi:hypothetical protein